MAVIWCPGCKKQREVRSVGAVIAISHLIERKYECPACGLVFEKPVGIWRRNRVYRETRKSRQIITLHLAQRQE